MGLSKLSNSRQKFLDLLHKNGEGYFAVKNHSNDTVKVVNYDDLQQYNKTHSIFFNVHPVNNSFNFEKTAKNDEIVGINCLFADFDAKDVNKDFLLQSINQIDYEPSVIIDTGNGYHCYWLLEKTYFEDIQSILSTWVKYVGADINAKSSNQLARLPGFSNPKYDNNPECKFVKRDFSLLYNMNTLLSELKIVKKVNTYSVSKVPDNILDTLSKLPLNIVDDYETWVKVGTILKNEYGNDGFNIWVQWSKRTSRIFEEEPKYKAKWNSFNAPDLKIGYLYKMAETQYKDKNEAKWIAKYTGRDLQRIINLPENKYDELLKKANIACDKKEAALELQEMILDKQTDIKVEICGDFTDESEQWDIRWLLKDLIARNQISFFTGPSAMGKTYITINMALSLITGNTFAGKYESTDKYNVAYFVGEGQEGFKSRLRAACLDKGITSAPKGFYLEIPNLTDQFAVYDTIKFLDKYNNHPDLIIFDTFSVALNGDDALGENTITAIRHMQTLAAYYDCAILCVHHPKKDHVTGYRGHSSIENNADNRFSVVARDGKYHFEKNKDRESTSKTLKESIQYSFRNTKYGSVIDFGKPIVIDELYLKLLEAFNFDDELLSKELKERLGYEGKDLNRDYKLNDYCSARGSKMNRLYTLNKR